MSQSRIPAHKLDGWSTSIRDDDDDDEDDDDEAHPNAATRSQLACAEGSDWDWDWSSELVDIGLVKEPAALQFVDTPFTLAKRNAALRLAHSAPATAAKSAIEAKARTPFQKRPAGRDRALQETPVAVVTKDTAPPAAVAPVIRANEKPASSVRSAVLQVSSAVVTFDTVTATTAPPRPAGTARSPPASSRPHVPVPKARLLASSRFRPAQSAPGTSPHLRTQPESAPSADEPSRAKPGAVPAACRPISSNKSAASAFSTADTPNMADCHAPDATSSSTSGVTVGDLRKRAAPPQPLFLDCQQRVALSPADRRSSADPPPTVTDALTSPTEMTMPSSEGDLCSSFRAGSRPGTVRTSARPSSTIENLVDPASEPSHCHKKQTNRPTELAEPKGAARLAARAPYVPSGGGRPRQSPQPRGFPRAGVELSLESSQAPQASEEDGPLAPHGVHRSQVPVQPPSQNPIPARAPSSLHAPPARFIESLRTRGGGGISPETRKRLDRFKRVRNFGTAAEAEGQTARPAATANATPIRTKVSAKFTLPGLGSSGGGGVSAERPSGEEGVSRRGRRLGFTPAESLAAFRARSTGRLRPSAAAPSSSSPSMRTGGARRPSEWSTRGTWEKGGGEELGISPEPVSPTPMGGRGRPVDRPPEEKKRERIVLGAAVRSVRPVTPMPAAGRPAGSRPSLPTGVKRPLALPRERLGETFEQDGDEAEDTEQQRQRRRRLLYRSSLGL